MEVAAKIIEASPKKAVRGEAGPTISSSVPLRIQDLKAKLEAQQPKKPSNFRIVNGKSNDRSPQGIRDARTLRRDVESDKGNSFQSSSGKTRLFVPTEQAKPNTQRREGKGLTSNRNLPSDRELKNSQRRTPTNGVRDNVLKQNNQKQNSSYERFGSVSKASSSPKVGPNKTRTVNKVPARAESTSSKTVRTNTLRNLSSSSSCSTKSLSQRKGAAGREISPMRSIATNVLISNDERSVKSKVVDDVISFTFTSPIKKSSEAQSPVRTVTRINKFARGESLTFLSPAESVIGESSLSILLEQKLQELKDRVESYEAERSYTSTVSLKEDEDSLSTCTSSVRDSVCTVSAQVGADVDEMSSLSDFDSSSTVDGRQNCQAQVAEAKEEHSMITTSGRTGKEVDHQLPNDSNLEPLLAAGSSHDNTVTCSVEFLEVEDNRPKLSETTSCSSVAYMREKYAAPALLSDINLIRPSNWEIEYIRDIIFEAESTLEDCLSTHPGEIIPPSLFDELESRGNVERSNSEEESSKLRRKILFDFVSECLALKCQDFLVGTPKGWARFTALFRRKSLLADEIYREVSRGNCIGDMMVDVLVDEDMSSKYGRWVDFRVEMFEEAVDIGQAILSSLVDELVSEFIVLSR
ncbi:uncharacterized protein LOC116214343 [Punica granatum]|nr:uncharacterized protein LOC116214343 [Punica granatum]